MTCLLLSRELPEWALADSIVDHKTDKRRDNPLACVEMMAEQIGPVRLRKIGKDGRKLVLGIMGGFEAVASLHPLIGEPFGPAITEIPEANVSLNRT